MRIIYRYVWNVKEKPVIGAKKKTLPCGQGLLRLTVDASSSEKA
jgi:hypothetical protein